MEISEASYKIVADLLEERSGQHLSPSRRWRIGTSLAGLFRERGISNVDQLVCLLADPREWALAEDVVEALLNNETYFFRDKPSFDKLASEILPQLARQRADRRQLRIWCAGCSTGQEVRSIEIQLAESAQNWEGWRIEILGTDISNRAISAAKRGCYSQFEVQRGLSVVQMLGFFDETPQGWQVKPGCAAKIEFRRHNILDDLPDPIKFDLVLCRNVLLYFDAARRNRAYRQLRRAIADDGFLMLGAGETTVGQSTEFEPSEGRRNIYEPVSVAEEGELRRAS